MDTPTQRLRAAVILGSTRKGRLCEKVARWAAARIEADARFELDVIDPATDAGADVGRTLQRADAFVVVTPEYNHGYPAPLKALIDAWYDEWQAKPVAFVSYGGLSGGLRAVEQLRQVFAELHTVTVRDGVSFDNAWDRFDAAGTLLEPERPERAMQVLLSRLHWWARALREARDARAYAEAV